MYFSRLVEGLWPWSRYGRSDRVIFRFIRFVAWKLFFYLRIPVCCSQRAPLHGSSTPRVRHHQLRSPPTPTAFFSEIHLLFKPRLFHQSNFRQDVMNITMDLESGGHWEWRPLGIADRHSLSSNSSAHFKCRGIVPRVSVNTQMVVFTSLQKLPIRLKFSGWSTLAMNYVQSLRPEWQLTFLFGRWWRKHCDLTSDGERFLIFIQSVILETYIAPLQNTTTQRRSQPSHGQRKKTWGKCKIWKGGSSARNAAQRVDHSMLMGQQPKRPFAAQ